MLHQTNVAQTTAPTQSEFFFATSSVTRVCPKTLRGCAIPLRHVLETPHSRSGPSLMNTARVFHCHDLLSLSAVEWPTSPCSQEVAVAKSRGQRVSWAPPFTQILNNLAVSQLLRFEIACMALWSVLDVVFSSLRSGDMFWDCVRTRGLWCAQEREQ